ncbi:conjugal transfer protein TraI [Escherichia coli]|uniref:Conjugal transfer protein TraI n=1 Tax=Escherichia coli TaxID=562 RepID=A0A377CWQ9_ECOLX|nr:conjugal transfer protein TraI [Escherichia coli]
MKNKDDETNNDAGNRGIIEVKGKAAPKKILILIILLIAALFVIIILFKVLSREQVVQQTPLEKSDETLVTNTNNGVSLATMMKNIEEKENSMPLTAGKHRRSKNRNRQTMPRQRQHHKRPIKQPSM